MLCIIVIVIPNLQCNVFDPHASEPIIAIAVHVCACNEKLVPWARLGIGTNYILVDIEHYPWTWKHLCEYCVLTNTGLYNMASSST